MKIKGLKGNNVHAMKNYIYILQGMKINLKIYLFVRRKKKCINTHDNRNSCDDQ